MLVITIKIYFKRSRKARNVAIVNSASKDIILLVKYDDTKVLSKSQYNILLTITSWPYSGLFLLAVTLSYLAIREVTCLCLTQYTRYIVLKHTKKN
jgi:hypothetical protein